MMLSVLSGSISGTRGIEVRELRIPLEQVVQLRLDLLRAAGDQHPQVLHRGPGHAVVEVHEVRTRVGPQHVAGMAVAVQAQRAVWRRLIEALLDEHQRIPRD